MKKFLIVLASLVLVGVLGVVCYITYLGFMPGLSSLVGTNKPRDLGVSYTQSDYNSFMEKTKTDYTELSGSPTPDKSIVFSGQKHLDTSFTQAEASARLNYDQWAYMPISNVQIRFNGDGSFEMSSNVVMGRLDGFISSIGGVGYSKQDIDRGLSYLGMIKNDPPLYIKASVSVSNNEPKINLESVEIGKIRVPIEGIDANGFLVGITKQVFSRVPGFQASSFSLSEGSANFSGEIPSKLQVQFAK